MKYKCILVVTTCTCRDEIEIIFSRKIECYS